MGQRLVTSLNHLDFKQK